MDEAKRNQLIEDYYTGIDTADGDLLRGAFTEDILHEHPVRTVEGLDAFLEFKTVDQRDAGIRHEVIRRIHTPDASVVQGRVVARTEEAPVQVEFCDVFEFTADDSAVEKLSVYARE